MTERATISQIVQLGMESTPGTAVAATKRLQSTMFNMGPKVDISKYRGAGYKYPAVAALNKEWVAGSFGGPLTYTELVYFLCGCIKNVSPVDAAGVETWTFSPATTTEDTVKTFTLEQGSAVRAHEVPYTLITGLGMKFDDSGAELSGNFIGQAMDDGITLTASGSVDEVALVPVTRAQTIIKLADTAAGLSAASAITRGFSAEWNISDRFMPVYPINQSTDFAVHVEQEPKVEAKLLLEADSVGMGLLTTMRANATKFMRIESTGALISGSDYYKLTLDAALKVTKDPSELKDEQGVFAVEWNFEGFYDATWTKAFNIVVVNELTAL